MAHARDLRGAHAHDRARRVRVAAAGHVAARGAAGDQLLADGESRQRLGLELVQGVPLPAGEVLHPVAREPDVFLHALRKGAFGRGEGRFAEHNVAVVTVQLACVATHRVLATCADLLQHAAHRLAGGGIDLRQGRVGLLDVVDGHVSRHGRRSHGRSPARLPAAASFAVACP